MKEYIEKYALIVGGVLIFIIIVLGIYQSSRNVDNLLVENTENEEVRQMGGFRGEVTRIFEGENTLRYSMDIPETATTTISMDNALIRITDNGVPYATIYISYEGGRGYSAVDYINNIIIPNVSSVVKTTDVVTVGDNTWQTAESLGSEWRVLTKGPWLMVVEYKKNLRESVNETLDSVVLEQ